jgi:hypothetical protein
MGRCGEVLGADPGTLFNITDLGMTLFLGNAVVSALLIYFVIRGNVPESIPVESYSKAFVGKIIMALLLAMLASSPAIGPATALAGMVSFLSLLGSGFFIYSVVFDVIVAAILRKLEFYGAFKVVIFNLLHLPFITTLALLLAYREQSGTLKRAREDLAYKDDGVVLGEAVQVVRLISQPIQSPTQARMSPHIDIRPLPSSVAILYSPELVEGRDFNPHVIIAGASGSGKTTLLYHIITELSKNYPTIFIDIKGDITRALLKEGVNARIVPVAAVGINPFHSIVEGERERHMVERLIDSISVVEEVGSRQAHFIREAYAEMEISKTPLTYSGLLARVVAKEEKALSADGSPYSHLGGGTRDALVGISSKIKDLAEYLRDNGASLKDIIRMAVDGRESNYPVLVFNLEDISEKVRAVVLELILRSIARYMHHRGPLAYLRDKALILAIDEAYLVTKPMRRKEGKSKSVLEEIARAGRSYGLALILATQRLSDVADGIRQNCQMWIVFNTASPEDVKILGELDAKVMARVVPKLKPGEAYIRVPNPTELDCYRTTTDTVTAIEGYIFRMRRRLLQSEQKKAEKLLQEIESRKANRGKGKDKRGRRLQVEEGAELEETGWDTGGGGGDEGSRSLNYGVVCYRCMLLTSDLNRCYVCGQPPLVKGPETTAGKRVKGEKREQATNITQQKISEVFVPVWVIGADTIKRRTAELYPEKAEDIQVLSEMDIVSLIECFKQGKIIDVDSYVSKGLVKKVGGGKIKPSSLGKAILDAYDELASKFMRGGNVA